MTVTASNNMPYLLPVLKEGPASAKKTAIELFAWNKENKYFAEVFPFTSSSDTMVRNAAIKSLASLAGPDDQDKLIDLLASTDNPEYITDLQAALAVSRRTGQIFRHALSDHPECYGWQSSEGEAYTCPG